ncbi:hypothetical protein SDC9_70456 [bioreactor metagenome]|uniref:Uncharacterized protein n=1 Tax=bioreactor metagenome TaxID=1076179 RepID=A0A644Y6P3_9ZZZZ
MRKLGDVQEGVAVGPGDLVVNFGDDDLGVLRRSLVLIHRRTKAAITVLIRRGHLDKGHGGVVGLGVHVGEVLEEDGGIEPRRLGDKVPGHRAAVGGGKAHLICDVAGQIGNVLRNGDELGDIDVFQVPDAPGKRVHRGFRLPRGEGEHDPVAGFDRLQR